MATDKAGETYLLIDIGHVLTHAAYAARVEGTARLVAVTEASTTHRGGSGLLEGVRRATANLELLIGRRILDTSGQVRRPSDSAGHGVDGVIVTTSLTLPLRVALVGLTRDLSLASAARAATLPYVALERILCLETSLRRWDSEDLEALIENPPDVVVLVGATDGGPVTPVQDVGVMMSTAYSILPPEMRPLVVFAGNERAQRSLVSAFSGVTELRLVPNVRPTAETENLGDLRDTLTRLFRRRAVSSSAQLQVLSEWAGDDIANDLDMLARTLRFVAQRYHLDRGVLGIDLGGNGSRLLRVRSSGAALSWASPYGMGAGLAALRELGDPTAVVRWMRHPLSWAEAWDRLSNMEVRPTGVPQTAEDWDLQQAAAREALQRTWSAASTTWAGFPGDHQSSAPVEMIVGRGTVLNHARTPGQAALTLIDALEPAGLLRLTLDWGNLLPGLAGLARRNPLAAVQVLDSDGLMELGTLIAPSGQVQPGQEALKARLIVRGEPRLEVSVPAGSIRRLPLGVNEHGRLELRPARGLDLGLGQRGRPAVAEVRGGALGVIIDARGRPLPLPELESQRCEVLATWQREIEEL